MTLLEFLSVYSVFVPALAGFVLLKNLNTPLKIFLILISVACIAELFNTYFFYNKLNNMWVLNFYCIIETVIMVRMLNFWFYKSWQKNLSIVLLVIYLIVAFYDLVVEPGMFTFNERQFTVRALFLLFLTVFPFVEAALDDSVPIHQNYIFWICAGMLLYFAIGVLVFATHNIRIGDFSLSYYTWGIHSYINILANLLFATGFICYYRRIRSFI